MKFFSKFLNLFRRRKLDTDMAEETQHHLELLAERHRAAGLSAGDAHYAARREFGNMVNIQEQARDGRGFIWLEQGWQDLRYAMRHLAKTPGFTFVVVLTLATGVGLSTVAFSFYRTLLGKPLAVQMPEEIQRVTADARRFQAPFTHDEFEDLQARLRSVDGVVATSPLQVLLIASAPQASEQQRPAAIQLVSPNYFSVLGVPAHLGRTFAADATTGVVVSYDAWHRRFRGDPAVVGRTVWIQGVPLTILGVAPESFGGTTPPSAPDIWIPMALQPQVLTGVDWLHDATVRIWQVLVRNKTGVSAKQVDAEIGVVAQTWRQPDGKPLQTRAQPATFFQLNSPQVHAVCLVLLLAVSLILLIGGINVVNLLFARNETRAHELAVRLALGASRVRLLRQLCTESILLGLLSGFAGFSLAWWACDGVRTWLTAVMREVTGGTWSPFLDLTPDLAVFAYSAGLALVTGAVVGLRPAWRSVRLDIEGVLKRRSAGHSGPGMFGQRNALLAVQVAASLVLLAGAGLLLRGARHAAETDPGFDAKHLLAVVAWSNLKTTAVSTTDQARRAREISDQLRTIPGVLSVSGADRTPFAGHSITAFVTDENRWINGCVTMNVDGAYFETLGLPLVAGRTFTEAEVSGTAPVTVITQSAANHLWPGKNPLGRQIRRVKTEQSAADILYTVIGVATDARLTELSKVDDVDIFFPQTATALWLVRTREAPESVVPPIYAALATLDPALPSHTAVWTMENGPMRVQLLMARAPASIASLLGLIALALSAVGIFGVVSFLVVRRTREFGVRLALGARKGDLIVLVLRQTLRPVAWGTAFGMAGAVAITVLLSRLVLNPAMPDFTYGAGALPLGTLAGVLGVMLGIVLLAAWLPARKAAKVDPMIALRAE